MPVGEWAFCKTTTPEYLRSIYLTFGISTILIICIKQIPGQTVLHPDLLLINAFFMALSVIIHRLVGVVSGKLKQIGPMVFLASTFFRMLIAVTALGIYVILKPQDRSTGLLLGLEFFLLYLLYAFVEIKSFMATLRLGSENQSKI